MQQGAEPSEDVQGSIEDLCDHILDQLDAAPDPDEYMATLLVALDQTGDLRKAAAMAEEHKSEPASPADGPVPKPMTPTYIESEEAR